MSAHLRAVDPTRRRLLSLSEAADWLGVTERTLRRKITAGEITAYRFGPRLVRIDAAELEALLVPIPTGGDVA